MAETVRTTYVIEGAQQGAQAIEQLIASMRQQIAAATVAGESTRGYKAVLGDLEGQLRDLRGAQVAQTEAASASGSAMQTLATSGTQLAQRIQGVAGAVQGLVGAMGSHDRTAGLVASVAGTTAQFAAMGAMLGPGGAIVGGLAGLTAGLLSAADAANEVTHSVEEMNAELARRARVDAANIGERAWAELERLRAAETAERDRAADDLLTGMMAEAERNLAEGRNADGSSRRRGGRRRDPLEGLLPDEASVSDIAGIGSELEGDRESRRLEERARAVEEYESERAKQAAIAELEAERASDAETERIEKARHLSDQAHERRVRQLQEETRILEDFGSTVGNVFGDAFGAAISGQESFDVALAKGTKNALIQFGTTMVAEGVGALLTAAGNIVINPPAAATKAVEGVGKLALGASLGAVGAAIPTPSAGAAGPQERPADRTPDGREGPAAPIIIQMNGQMVTGTTEASLGRTLGRLASTGTRRFGGREAA